jgi:glutathione S-transferase
VIAELFHLALPEDWEHATAIGLYPFSTRGLTWQQVGFVHCAHRHQLVGVANRFYSDCPNLMVLELNPTSLVELGLEVIEEPAAENATELFPHLYGQLPLGVVRAVHSWAVSQHGTFCDPPL